jgi:ABC-type spermidine/putrescine transport system permease subunit I
MKRRGSYFSVWLGAAAVLVCLLFATPAAAITRTTVTTPEPATLTLVALGGGALALARYRKSRRGK